MTELVVSEVFGPTFQGEGPSTGRRAAFIRLGRCNLTCGKGEGATWACDTPYTWDWDRFDPAQELRKVDVNDLAEQVRAMDAPLTVITGGEPLNQQAALAELLSILDTRIEIETNGTRAPQPNVMVRARFNVSPKLANSGVEKHLRLKPMALENLARSGRAIFKFVVTSDADLEEVDDIVTAHSIDPETVWIMPGGTEAEALEKTATEIAGAVLERKWNLTQRLHVLLWENQRAR